MDFIDRLWHQCQGHRITYHPALVPDEVMGEGVTKINVYRQDKFQYPHAHYECSCTKTWGV